MQIARKRAKADAKVRLFFEPPNFSADIFQKNPKFFMLSRIILPYTLLYIGTWVEETNRLILVKVA